MNYRTVLVARWSRRDWLAVLVVALVAALLVGTTLLVVTAGDETTAIAEELDTDATVTHYDSLEAARASARSDAVVLPLVTATGSDGETTRAVGVPVTAPVDIELSPIPDSAEASGPVGSDEEWQLEGTDAAETVVVSPGGNAGVVPPSWVRVRADTIERAGATGALVLTPTEGATVEEGSPLIGVLSFFVGGTDEVVAILVSGVAVAGLIVGVTVWSVVRMLVSDRARTIRVARATGAPPRRITATIAARAGLLTAAGVTLGYAIGLIVPNVAINIAVSLGFPTTLALRVTPSVALLLAGMLGSLVAVGVASGYLAARAVTVVPVAAVDGSAEGRSVVVTGWVPIAVRERLWPTLLAPRAVLPTAATLSAFAIVVLLIVALGGVGASLGTEGTTISDPEAPQPVESSVPESYAAALESNDVAASPEILLFGYRDGQPYLARGVDYDRFAAVTDARLRDGHQPGGPGEAVIGVKAARTLGVETGDSLTMGGSTEPAVDQVDVVGIYETGGIDDHQVLVSLETARHLSTVPTGEVNIIRTDADIDASSADAKPDVLGVSAPRYSRPGEAIQVAVTVWNPAAEPRAMDVTATLGESRETQTVTVGPQERRTVQLELSGQRAGEYELAVGETRQPVTVTETPPVTVIIPDEVPPGEAVQVRVIDESGKAVDDGTVALGEAEVALTADGTAWVRTPERAGESAVVVRRSGQETRQPVQVTAGASKSLIGAVSIEPVKPTVHVTPTATVQLWNPWNRSIDTSVTVDGPGVTAVEAVTVDPGEETVVTATLDRRPPGEYSVTVSADGTRVVSGTYEISGDDRLGAALAVGGHDGGGLGSAIEYAVGNLSVLLGALVALTAVSTVGALSAVLARAIRAKRHTIGVYRSTGASAGRVLGLVLGDTVRIGVVSSLLALSAGVVVTETLAGLGHLTAFGIALDPRPSVLQAAGMVVSGTMLALLAALAVTVDIVRRPVREQLADSEGRKTPQEEVGNDVSTAGRRQARAGDGAGTTAEIDD